MTDRVIEEHLLNDYQRNFPLEPRPFARIGGDLGASASDDIRPLHLHRHSFELIRIGGKPTAGVIKDVVMLGGFQEMEFDFVADNPGMTLFHCHQQLHMDFGFMALFNYA